MNRLRGILLASVFAVLFAGLVWAADMQEVKAEYSADEYMETEDATMHAKVFRAPGKERKELDMGEMEKMGSDANSITIIRKDKSVIWTLMPQMGTYMERAIGEADHGAEDMKIAEQTVVGEEVIEGIKTTKSKVVMKDSKGNAFGGFMWTTEEGIMVKMDTIIKQKNKKARMKIELKNLKVEKQDAALFEIPEGYSKMSMGGMMFGGGSSPSKSGKGKTMIKGKDADEEDDEVEEEEGGSSKDKALRKLKGLW